MTRVLSVMTVAVSLLLVALVAGSATAQPDGSIAVAPYSVWTDAKHGWSVDHQGSEVLRTKNGGRTWPAPVFIGGNYVFDLVRTSRRAALVESGNWSGYTMWTNDGGSHWFETSAFPRADYYGGALGLVRAGRGRLLFWHQHGSALYRVNGWPPRGSFACTRSSHWPNELPNHPICDQPPGDAGLSSVEVARLDAGRFGPMAAFTDGVAALVIGGPNVAQSARLALIRDDSFSLITLPDASLPPRAALTDFAVTGVGRRLYVTAQVVQGVEGSTEVLWRSADGGSSWTVALGTAFPRVLLSGAARSVGVRTWLPGGFAARARRRGALMIKRLGRTRLLALPGASVCTSMSLVFDPNLGSSLKPKPQLFVEGRRAERTGVWWSRDAGGSSWSRFGGC